MSIFRIITVIVSKKIARVLKTMFETWTKSFGQEKKTAVV